MSRRRRATETVVARLSPAPTMSDAPTFTPLRAGQSRDLRASSLPAVQPSPGCHLYRLPAGVIESPAELHVHGVQKSVETFSQLELALEANWLTEHLAQDVRAKVVHHMIKMEFEADEQVIVGGEPSHAVFVISDGQCESVTTNAVDGGAPSGGSTSMVLEPGDVFGEGALVHACMSSESVVCCTKVTAWTIGRELYQKVLQTHAQNAFRTRFQMMRSIRWLDVLSDTQIRKLASNSRLHCCMVGRRIAFRKMAVPRCRYVLEKQSKSAKVSFAATSEGIFDMTSAGMSLMAVGSVQTLRSDALDPPPGHDTLLLLERVVPVNAYDTLEGADEHDPSSDEPCSDDESAEQMQAVTQLIEKAVTAAVADASGMPATPRGTPRGTPRVCTGTPKRGATRKRSKPLELQVQPSASAVQRGHCLHCVISVRKTELTSARLAMQMLVIGGHSFCRSIGPRAVGAVSHAIDTLVGQHTLDPATTPGGSVRPVPRPSAAELGMASAVNNYGRRFDQHDPTGRLSPSLSPKKLREAKAENAKRRSPRKQPVRRRSPSRQPMSTLRRRSPQRRPAQTPELEPEPEPKSAGEEDEEDEEDEETKEEIAAMKAMFGVGPEDELVGSGGLIDRRSVPAVELQSLEMFRSQASDSSFSEADGPWLAFHHPSRQYVVVERWQDRHSPAGWEALETWAAVPHSPRLNRLLVSTAHCRS